MHSDHWLNILALCHVVCLTIQAKLTAAATAAVLAQEAAQAKLDAEQQSRATLEAELQVHLVHTILSQRPVQSSGFLFT
jgi:hypothetical protein